MMSCAFIASEATGNEASAPMRVTAAAARSAFFLLSTDSPDVATFAALAALGRQRRWPPVLGNVSKRGCRLVSLHRVRNECGLSVASVGFGGEAPAAAPAPPTT
jgi:hypothetical protein